MLILKLLWKFAKNSSNKVIFSRRKKAKRRKRKKMCHLHIPRLRQNKVSLFPSVKTTCKTMRLLGIQKRVTFGSIPKIIMDPMLSYMMITPMSIQCVLRLISLLTSLLVVCPLVFQLHIALLKTSKKFQVRNPEWLN